MLTTCQGRSPLNTHETVQHQILGCQSLLLPIIFLAYKAIQKSNEILNIHQESLQIETFSLFDQSLYQKWGRALLL